MKMYLERDPHIIAWRDHGIRVGQATMEALLAQNLESRIALVEDTAVGHLTDPAKVWLEPLAPAARWQTFQFSFDQAARHTGGNLMEYSFPLPAGFPKYLATGVFTKDYDSWRLTLGQKSLSPAQGTLTFAYTFDAQNAREGRLTVALPDKHAINGEILQLNVKMPDYITDIWRNEHDRLGVTLKTPKDGWMVLHYPFDPKWQLTVDDKPVPLSRVNTYFMGASVPAGEHRLLFTYWPQTPLRWVLIISMALMVMAVEGLIIYAFWQRSRY